MVSHFVLNIPLAKIKKPIRTYRRKANLDAFYNDYLDYFIIDIDDVKSAFDKHKILDYFKEYKVIIGESKSYNGINNFNLKGILFTESIDFKDAKAALSIIHNDLKDLCTVDESVVRKASLNAPILKSNVFLNNEDGILFKFIKKDDYEHINEVRKENVGEWANFDIKELKDIKAESVEKLCLNVFQTMGFSGVRTNPNGSISFKHPCEKRTPGGYFWFSTSPFTMHHCNSTKTINIFDSVRKLPAAKELMRKRINYDNLLVKNADVSILKVNERFLSVTDKVSSKITDFLSNKNGLLSIRSPMGTGKSNIINHIIKECHDQDMKVLIITNKISVAHDFGKKYDIKVYNQDKYDIGDSLVCQYDSLWKYNIKFFDIVIMDEFISLMIHSRSNLNNSSINIAKFFGCFNKKLVIADAFLTGYESNLLSNKITNTHLIDNEYRDQTALYSYIDANYFVQSILAYSEKNKVTISSTSLQFIYSTQLLLEKHGLKVITLTADTPDTTKKLIYELFEQNDHDKWDVLIFSPTLTVGVSNLNNIDYHFHFDSSMSTDVISSIQMIKRTRKAKEIHLLVKEKINYIKTSYNEIRDDYMRNIGQNIDQNYLFSIDDYGEIRLSEIGKKAIKIDAFKNILEFDHKSSLLWMLKYHFDKEPITVKEKSRYNILNKYSKTVRDDKQRLAESNIDQFLKLNSIEKTNLLMSYDVDRTMRTLAEIDDEINECPPDIKSKLLEMSLRDSDFLVKAKYYRAAINFTRKIWNESDIKNLISQSVVKGKSNDIHFYNTLISYGQNEISDEYLPRIINKKRQLKFILDKCGYSITKQSQPSVIGHRGYCVDANIKEYYEYLK